MINSLSKTAEALVKEWPEIFENVEINAIPVMYLDKVTIKFITGMIWEVDIKNYLDSFAVETIHDLLQELFIEYKNEIDDIEYAFNIDHLKNDIAILSNKIL